MVWEDETVGPVLVAAVWSCVFVSSCFVAMRCVAKINTARLWWDDGILLVSWLCILTASIFMTAAVFNAKLGHHVDVLSQDQISYILLHCTTIAAIITISASVWSKVAFGACLLRICRSKGTTKKVQMLVWLVIISMNGTLLVVIVLFLVTCRPGYKAWEPWVQGECFSDGIRVWGAISVAVYSGMMDLLLAFLPWKIIWNLQMKRAEKISLIAAMSMGVFAAIASFIKAAYIPDIILEDFTYYSFNICFWAVLEPTITIITASLPILRVLVKKNNPSPTPTPNASNPSHHSRKASTATTASKPRPSTCLSPTKSRRDGTTTLITANSPSDTKARGSVDMGREKQDVKTDVTLIAVHPGTQVETGPLPEDGGLEIPLTRWKTWRSGEDERKKEASLVSEREIV